jgi:hypothetical protein
LSWKQIAPDDITQMRSLIGVTSVKRLARPSER